MEHPGPAPTDDDMGASSPVPTDDDVGAPRPVPDARLRVAGAAAAAVAVAFLFVLSAWEEVSFPLAAAAGALLRASPGDLATFFIETLGHWARPLLLAGVLAATVIVGGEALVRTRAPAGAPRPWMAAAVLAVVAGIGAMLGPSPGAHPVATSIAIALGALVYTGVSTLLLRPARQPEADLGRRNVLRMGTGAAAGLAVAGGALGWVLRRLGGPDTDVQLVAPAAPATIPARDAFPEIPGLTPEVTSAADHYVVDINLIPPSVEAEGWSLEVRGEIERPRSFSFTSLQEEFEVVEEFAVLTCISNEVNGQLIGHSRWGGVRLTDVLRSVGVRDGAMDVVFNAADGYSDSITLETAMHETNLIAVSQNGAPLTQAHGFPCRMRIPAIYGMKNVKWLESIEVVPRDYKGYWMQRGWSDEAVIDTESRIDVAGNEGRARVGEQTWIAGIAWAGIRGVSKVEVSADGGTTWTEALVKEPISPISWRQWAYRWTPAEAGRAEIRCRATDGEGKVQTKMNVPPHPDGATGYPVTFVEVS